jgi:hypothetical protein
MKCVIALTSRDTILDLVNNASEQPAKNVFLNGRELMSYTQGKDKGRTDMGTSECFVVATEKRKSLSMSESRD